MKAIIHINKIQLHVSGFPAGGLNQNHRLFSVLSSLYCTVLGSNVTQPETPEIVAADLFIAQEVVLPDDKGPTGACLVARGRWLHPAHPPVPGLGRPGGQLLECWVWGSGGFS